MARAKQMSERVKMSIDELRNLYISLFGLEPAEPHVLTEIEGDLGVKLPSDFKQIASFYSGGIVGGISHHATATSGPANNITDETKRLRQTIKLPHSMIVLAEPPASLVVMITQRNEDQPAVIWLDSIDVSRLADLRSLRKPQLWNSYDDFFQFLLNREEEERG